MGAEKTCEIPSSNPPGEQIRQILLSSKVIAIVGASDKPGRPSHRVAAYLKLKGYRIIPVNPNVKEVLGEKAYPDLRSIPEKVDIVDIFRRVEDVPGIVDDAISIGAPVVWMQEGIVHNESAKKATSRGITVVMGKCIMKEHRSLFSEGA